jgi:hypothetical protein
MMRTSILAALPFTLLIAGCDRAADEHDHAAVDELRMELEQLTNTVGRLEFRVYELEDHHNDVPVTRAPKSFDQDQDNSETEPDERQDDDGHFDLTPIE